MQKELPHINKDRAFSLIEVVVSAALILMLATLFTAAVLYGEESSGVAGQRNRAGLIAEEGLEATRNMRDLSFSNLVDGTHGIGQTSNTWSFVGASDTQDIFTRSVVVASVDSVTKQVTSTVTWPENAIRNGSLSIVTYLTNTQLLSQQSNSLVVDTSAAVSGGAGSKDVTGITLKNAGSNTITITKMQTSWVSTSSSINQILINALTVWTGTQSSGTIEDITDTSISAGTTLPITRLRFSGSMAGKTMTIIFTMSDGSTKTVNTSTL